MSRGEHRGRTDHVPGSINVGCFPAYLEYLASIECGVHPAFNLPCLALTTQPGTRFVLLGPTMFRLRSSHILCTSNAIQLAWYARGTGLAVSVFRAAKTG